MAALQRAKSNVRSPSELQPVLLCLPLTDCSQSLFFAFSHTVSLNCLFPPEHPIFIVLSTVSRFEWTVLLLFSNFQPGPFHPNLFLSLLV